MRFAFFYHSLVSDWNHGNAHFLRGIVTELLRRGHQVQVFEPTTGWSRENLLRDHGSSAIQQFYEFYPTLTSIFYDSTLDLEQVAVDNDVVIMHEWNEPWLINAMGELRNRVQTGSNPDQSFRLLFHDTHHRAISDSTWLKRFKLDSFDGVLAFGDVLAQVYRDHGWHNSVWTWHEAADTQVFYPRESNPDYPTGDVAWIGNWGDDERSQELNTYLFQPVQKMKLSCHIYGVRYPQGVLKRLQQQGIEYGGWLPNFHAPQVFANHRVTVHIPRRYYAESLPGIPTIRPFEAMACGIPLISAPWLDSERLFSPGRDYVVANNAHEMQQHLRSILYDRDFAQHMADQALTTILDRHTCSHRVDQLLQICQVLGTPSEGLPLAYHPSSFSSTHLYSTGGPTHAYR